MEVQAFFFTTRDIIWSILPFFFAWLAYQLKKSKIAMDRVLFILKKVDEIVEWVESEFPDLPYIDKIDRVIDTLIKALEDAGYKIPAREELEYITKAAFSRYKKEKLTLDRLLNNGSDT